jgi:hypothetical protein
MSLREKMKRTKKVKTASMTLIIERQTQRVLQPTAMRTQLLHLRSRVETQTRVRQGISVDSMKAPDGIQNPQRQNGVLVYRIQFRIVSKPSRGVSLEQTQKRFDDILNVVQRAGNQSGWVPIERDGEKLQGNVDATEVAQTGPTVVTTVTIPPPAERVQYFDHLFEREDHRDILIASLDAAVQSGFHNRFHTLLWGLPGCGKSDLLLSLERMVGSAAVTRFNATETTSAGAIASMAGRQTMPPILIVEEIEKADEGSLRWLLGALDHRGEVRKTTYRGETNFTARFLCYATVNDLDLFRGMMSGALASRFPHKLKCEPPSRTALEKILAREIDRLRQSGNPAENSWIEPTLDYCEEMKITDPRRVQAICLSGQNDLLPDAKRSPYLTKLRKLTLDLG